MFLMGPDWQRKFEVESIFRARVSVLESSWPAEHGKLPSKAFEYRGVRKKQRA